MDRVHEGTGTGSTGVVHGPWVHVLYTSGCSFENGAWSKYRGLVKFLVTKPLYFDCAQFQRKSVLAKTSSGLRENKPIEYWEEYSGAS